MLCSVAGHCQSDEAKVKAAFLYNFAKYVEWPSSAFDGGGSPLVIGVIGSGPMSDALESVVDGKTVGGRRLVIRHLKWNDNLASVQELFVPADQMSGSAKLEPLKSKPILIIGESAGFARRHGAINFVVVGSRVRFEINESAAGQAGLTISSKLLSLGRPPA